MSSVCPTGGAGLAGDPAVAPPARGPGVPVPGAATKEPLSSPGGSTEGDGSEDLPVQDMK